ncbi:atp-dependent rrna helicase rrp3 [Moniliophthora roreri]|nr:atp-dependent rrna helicase rrp3 [Moniliophthora roreri]
MRTVFRFRMEATCRQVCSLDLPLFHFEGGGGIHYVYPRRISLPWIKKNAGSGCCSTCVNSSLYEVSLGPASLGIAPQKTSVLHRYSPTGIYTVEDGLPTA